MIRDDSFLLVRGTELVDLPPCLHTQACRCMEALPVRSKREVTTSTPNRSNSRSAVTKRVTMNDTGRLGLGLYWSGHSKHEHVAGLRYDRMISVQCSSMYEVMGREMRKSSD